MPKKMAHTRSSVQQRRKPKAQKSIELVRPKSAEDEIDSNEDADEPTSVGVATSTATAPSPKREKATTRSTRSEKAVAVSPESEKTTAPKSEKTPVLETIEEDEPAEAVEETVPAPKSSAAARLAARRQAAQKAQRSVSLISAENYSYVRKDLIFIAILAIIMFSAIIILHFVPAIGG